ncbi:TolC family protein [Cetobacterium sp.]|uniref:TolC family protein n=1 Tax=Cetobacterium sp. TaxID=2071632 RepID=UPI003F2E6EAC
MYKKIVSVMVLASSSVYCQSLELNEVIKKVYENNFIMKKQDLTIENNVITTKNYYKKRFLPSIDFGAEGELSEIADKGVGPEVISMKIDLDLGRQGLNEYRIKKNNLEIAELNRKKAWSTLEEAVISTYFEYLSITKKIEYIEKTQNILNGHRSKLSRMLNGGNLIPKNELLKIEIDIEENKIQLLSSKHNQNVLKQKLYTQMGMELDRDIDFKEVDSSKLYLDKSLGEIEVIQNKGLKMSIKSRITELQIENTIYDNKIAKAELLPKFYIKPEYRFEDAGYSEKGGRFLVGFNWTFDWGNTLNDIEVSNNNVKISEMDHKERVANLTLEIRENFEALKMAKLSLEVKKKKIELLRENLKLDTSRFENRMMKSNEYLDSVNSLKAEEENLYKEQQQLFLLNLKLKNLIS